MYLQISCGRQSVSFQIYNNSFLIVCSILSQSASQHSVVRQNFNHCSFLCLISGPKQIQLQPENKSSGDVHPKRKQSNGELDIPPEARIDRYKSGTEDMGFSSFQYNVMEQEGNNFVTINGKEHLALSPTRQHILTEVILEKGESTK